MLKLPVPEAVYEDVVLKPSEYQQEMVESLADRAQAVRDRLVDPSQDNMLRITNDGRKLALDQRLVNPMLPDNEDSKVNACVEKALDIWKETAEQKSTQLIFCDLSTPKAVGKAKAEINGKEEDAEVFDAELQKAWDENREEFRRLKEEMEKNEDAFLKIDQEMEAMEQEPIKDSDVVVMFSSQFETDYVVCKITDQSREWVKEQMNNIAGMDEDALANLDVEEYFRDQGAEVMSILASNGKGDDYPVFYDFWFDVDEAEVVESTELSIEKQVENLINRIDFGEPVLNDSEWKLLHTYAEKTGNMADTYKLAQELRDTLHHPDFRVHEQVIENARKELEAPVFLNEKEKELFTGETDRFGIYQLKDGEELHYHRFASLDLLEKSGLQVEKGNYELIYTAPLQKGQTLDDIFEQFNLFRPEDFTGHSLSVSDIVLLHQNGENHAQYVDRFGFQEVAQFLEQQQDREEQKAEQAL